MNDKRNLGRGLGDMIEEVSTVRAIPSQPAVGIAEALAAARSSANPAAETVEAPAEKTDTVAEIRPQSTADEAREKNAAAETIVVEAGGQLPPTIIEERPADAQLNGQPELRTVEKIVRMPFVPLWAKLAVAVLAGIIVVLIVTLTIFRTDILRAEGEAKSLSTELQIATAKLAEDPLVWTERIQIKGLRVERFGKNARIIFDGPFFVSDVKWSPATDQLFRALLAEIAPHAGNCFLTIVGHTARQPQPKGSAYRDNFEMGLRRAEAVMDAMVRGVRWPLSGVSARSDGDKYPPYRGDDVLSQIRNRTITIEIRTK